MRREYIFFLGTCEALVVGSSEVEYMAPLYKDYARASSTIIPGREKNPLKFSLSRAGLVVVV
jgi:hypothetical protein